MVPLPLGSSRPICRYCQRGCSTEYIDEFGNETASADGFSTLPEWSPIFLNKGELTFNTSGNLVSPSGGAELETVSSLVVEVL